MKTFRERIDGVPPLGKILFLLAVPWGFVTAWFADRAFYAGALVLMASALGWSVAALLMHRPRCVSLVALNASAVALTALFFPFDNAGPYVVHHWSHPHLLGTVCFLFTWLVLVPVGCTWLVERVVHLILKRCARA